MILGKLTGEVSSWHLQSHARAISLLDLAVDALDLGAILEKKKKNKDNRVCTEIHETGLADPFRLLPTMLDPPRGSHSPVQNQWVILWWVVGVICGMGHQWVGSCVIGHHMGGVISSWLILCGE